jgi:hypothetical protein
VSRHSFFSSILKSNYNVLGKRCKHVILTGAAKMHPVVVVEPVPALAQVAVALMKAAQVVQIPRRQSTIERFFMNSMRSR